MSVWTRADGYVVSDEPARIDRTRVYGWISNAYWAAGIPRDVFERSVDGAMCFGVYAPDGAQVGFARVMTDRATFGYLGDVFVVPELRGRGLSKFLLDSIFGHPDLQGFRRWSLATRDAHALYARYGFAPLADPLRYMERADPDVYRRRQAGE
ncbi:MAG: GNAT family N-acetyltransferase [Rhodospirillales bacterium]|nr:GNAT family N-acetyltransferase [Rhodospirillales bacterium]